MSPAFISTAPPFCKSCESLHKSVPPKPRSPSLFPPSGLGCDMFPANRTQLFPGSKSPGAGTALILAPLAAAQAGLGDGRANEAGMNTKEAPRHRGLCGGCRAALSPCKKQIGELYMSKRSLFLPVYMCIPKPQQHVNRRAPEQRVKTSPCGVQAVRMPPPRRTRAAAIPLYLIRNAQQHPADKATANKVHGEGGRGEKRIFFFFLKKGVRRNSSFTDL